MMRAAGCNVQFPVPETLYLFAETIYSNAHRPYNRRCCPTRRFGNPDPIIPAKAEMHPAFRVESGVGSGSFGARVFPRFSKGRHSEWDAPPLSAISISP